MSIQFATPCYGNMVTRAYLQSCINLQTDLVRSGIRHEWQFMGNESLITRARNNIAASFLRCSDMDFLMFIDADIEFMPKDVTALFNLDVEVAVGCYRLKKPESEFAAWVNGKLVTDLDNFPGPVAVDYAGTGFMLIRRRALVKLAEHVETYLGETGLKTWNFFNTPVVGSNGDPDAWRKRFLTSEDYYFCDRWRGIDGVITMDPSVRLKHWGQIAFG